MKTKFWVIALAFSMPVWAWGQNEPSNREQKIQQLKDQIEQLESLVDSISDEIDLDMDFDGDDKKFEWESDRVKIDLSKGQESLTQSTFLFSLGPTFLIDDEVSNAPTPDFKPFRSWSGQIGFGFLTRFGHQSNLGLEYGLVYRFTELDNRDDHILTKYGNNRYIYSKGQELKQSEIYANYLSVPIALRINDRNNSKFSISIGGFAGVRLGGTQEIKYELDGEKVKTRSRNDYGLPDFNYGLSFGIGGESVQLYSTYELSNFFEEDDIYKWNVLTTGVRLAF